MTGLNDAGYAIPTTGIVAVATVGTALPAYSVVAALSATWPAAPVGWGILGHVGTEDNTGAPEFSFDGGETTVKGSWSKKSIRTTKSPVTETATFSLSQIDRTTLGYYYGGTGGSTAGQFDTNTTDTATDTRTAMLVLFNDNGNIFGWGWSQVSVSRADTIALSDAENPVLIPVGATILDPSSGTLKQRVYGGTIGTS